MFEAFFAGTIRRKMDRSMKIVDIKIHSIAIADPPLRSSYGLHAAYALRTIIELVSEDGIRGVSETHGGESIAQALQAMRSEVVGNDAYRLSGKLVAMIERPLPASSLERSQIFLLPGENPFDVSQRLYSGVEIACLDLIGKSVGKPVCDLLGGRVRDSVPFSAYVFYKHSGGGGEGSDARRDEYGEALNPEPLVAQARQMMARYGFRDIKFKAGVLDPEVEIESVRQLCVAFGPTVPVRMDPNCAWSVETSVRVGKALRQEFGDGGYLEDPTATLEGMSQVRRLLLDAGISTPLASNVA